MTETTSLRSFSKAFWVANTVELLERMAYYGVFIVLTLYLSNILGFNDFEAAMISGLFQADFICCLCLRVLMPTRLVSASRCWWRSCF